MTKWPAKSQDLTPLDYFLWEELKKAMNPVENKSTKYFTSDEIANSEDESTLLRSANVDKITFRNDLCQACEKIDPKLLKNAVEELPTRWDKCIEANGGRFSM